MTTMKYIDDTALGIAATSFFTTKSKKDIAKSPTLGVTPKHN